MRTYKQIVKEITQNIVANIFCDKCGKTILVKKTEYNFIRGGQVEMKFGYGSKYDSDLYRFELCDECVENFLKSFKHPCLKSEEL